MRSLFGAAILIALCAACRPALPLLPSPVRGGAGGEVVPSPTASPPAPLVSPTAATEQSLARLLDGLQVETHWLKGVGVNWQTGEPNNKAVPLDDTHCSAFVAAVSVKLGVYLLRPPEHKTNMLANAQNEWLNAQGAEFGWERVADSLRAQELANQGFFVIASYRNPVPTQHGHIAVVRPSDKSMALILAEGPQVIQAGNHNYNSASVQQGFASHPSAFAKNRIQYFAHKISLGALSMNLQE